MPSFAAGETLRAAEARSYLSGKGVNVLTTLSGLGRAALCSGVVLCGRGEAGQYEHLLRRLGVHDVRIVGGEFATRRHVTILDPTSFTGRVTHVQVVGIPHPPELFDFGTSTRGAAVAAAIDGQRHGMLLVLSGSLPQGAPTGLYGELVRAWRRSGGLCAVDTSGGALRAAIAEGPYFIKPNRVELEELMDAPLGEGPRPLAAAARHIAAKHSIEWVCVSDGAAGIVLLSRESGECWHGTLELRDEEEVVTEQGCGDACVAGFISAQLEGASIVDTVRYIVGAATANLLSQGPGTVDGLLAAGLRDRVQATEVL